MKVKRESSTIPRSDVTVRKKKLNENLDGGEKMSRVSKKRKEKPRGLFDSH